MMIREQEELNIEVDPDTERVPFKYLIINDLGRLADNHQQAISIAKNQETKSKRKSKLALYNAKIQEFVDQGVL